MASVQDAIRRLVIQASAPGAAQATAELQALAAAQGGVAVASAVTERATTSLDSKFASIERRYNTAIRNQQDFAKIQTQVNAAVAQNPALQDRANAVLAAAADRYGQVTGAQKAFGIASQTANLQIAAFASGLGLTGQILSAFGPQGFAAAVALGTVQSALSLASEKSHELAQKSKEIFEFSEATGLTTTQFQALRSEAGKFGIDSETLAGGLTKFTAGFQNLRLGQGDLLTQIRRVNPALADQMQQTTDAATAFTLFGKAVNATNDIFQRNALLKAGMGRGSATFGAFFASSPDVNGLATSFAAAGKGIEADLIPKLKQLQIDIDKTRGAANTVFATMFGTSTLESELEFQRGLLSIATALKNMTFSDDFKKFINFLTDPATLLVLGALATAAAVASGGTLVAVAGAGLAGAGAYGAAKGAIQEQGRSEPDAKSGSYVPDFNETFSDVQKSGADTAKRTQQADLADLERRVSLLGSAATATDRYNVAVAKLNMGQDGLKLSTEDYSRALAGLQLDKAISVQNAHNAALGASTPIADLVIAKTQQLQKLQQQGANLSPAQIKFQQDLVAAQALGTFQIDAQTKAEQVHIATLGMTAEQGLAYSIVQTKINESIAVGNPLKDQDIAKLQKSADAYAKVKVAGDRYEETMRSVNQATTQFADNLVQGLLKGGDAMATLTSGLGALGSSLTSIGTKNVSDGLSGMLKGLGTSGFDPVSLGIGAAGMGISLITNLIGGDEKKRAELEAAQAEWKKAGPAFQKFLTEMSGGVQGDIAATFQQNFQTAYGLAVQADKAGDRAAVTRIYEAEGRNAIDQSRKFLSTFDAALQGMTDGLGSNSPFLQAVNNVKDQLATVQKFVDDARVAAGAVVGGVDLTTGETLAGANASQLAAIADATGRATTAAETYLVSLLQAAPTLSTVQTAMMNVNGTAAALQTSLVQLGMSSESAAAEIKIGVSKALDAIKSQFEDSLTERLNTANGAGYLNDAAALVKQHAQDVSDAAALGVSQADVAAVFHAEAQKIVDDAGLVGDAFNTFLIQFPQFAGIVDQSSSALAQAAADQAKAAQDAADAIKKTLSDVASYITQVSKTIQDYINGLRTGSNSTLSPQDKLNTAQAQFNTQFALAQAGDRAALGTITQYSDTLLAAAKDFFASSSGYTDIFNQVTSKLQSIPDNLTVSQVSAADQIVAAIQAQQAATISKLQAGTVQTIAAQYASAGQTVDALYDANGQIVGVTVAQTGAIAGTTQAVNATGASNDSLTSQQSTLIASQNALAAQQTTYLATQAQLLGAINVLSDRTVAAMNGVGSLMASIGSGHAEWFRIIASLLQQQLNQGASSGGGGSVWSWLGFQSGGRIPGFADGGMVGNGMYNVDSVLARYAGGGNIALAGGEYVNRATSVNSSTLPTLQYINDNGRVPSSGDNGQHFSALANTLVRAMAGVSMTEISAMREENAALRADIARLTRAVEGNKPPPQRAGTRDRVAS